MKNVKNTANRDTINRFLSSPGYIFCVFALVCLGNLFSLELPVYLVFTLICLYVSFWGEDLRSLMPLFIAGYITPSISSNPGRNETGVFSGFSGICVIILAACIAAGITAYVLRRKKDFFSAKRRLLTGMLILSGVYLISGINNIPEIHKHIPFALIQGVSIILPYWLLSVGINWKTLRKDYLAWICLCAGFALAVEVLWIYSTGKVIVNGVINRDFIYTGWGIHNNLGVYLAMMIPAAFYLGSQYHRNWIGIVAGTVLLGFVFLTCSRSSILGGCLAYGLSIVLMLFYSQNRRKNTTALLAVMGFAVLLLLLFGKHLYHLFSDLLQMGMDPSHRDEIYAEGLKIFAKRPILGSSFFSPGYKPWDWSTVAGFSNFFPPRWHNTVVQLLASCGIVGLAAYSFHRWQTIRLFFLQRTKETNFIGCTVLILLLCSLLDCHFFNVGPTLFYSMALAVAEFTPKGDIV